MMILGFDGGTIRFGMRREWGVFQMPEKVMITGGAGFIGRFVSD